MLNIATIARLEDDFIGGTATTGLIGSLGWQFTAAGTGTISKTTSVSKHAGLITLSTGTVANQSTSVYLSNGVGNGTIDPVQVSAMQFCVALGSTANIRVRVGMGSTVNATNWGNNGVFIEYDSSASANWRLIIRDAGSTLSTTDLGTAATTDYTILAFSRYTTGWTGVVDIGGTKTEANTTSTTTSGNILTVGIQCETLTGSSKTLIVDAFGMNYSARSMTAYLNHNRR